ncbi:uncharacterized protein LY89DRAFT_721308 [Mollisia scopiformis]|uniref:Tat pathway signal sequence n=1 Tax=Mollisia scopiformis TaxID=149040 RepID=A0A194WZ83_MOLSC|nr:uncharacterized protein LY89DRAFT_721308 [Mollisia scopiformis]KUJ13261.1 hypothetical protein LY89DRAFT_721308 [Mollisia scopiformis]
MSQKYQALPQTADFEAQPLRKQQSTWARLAVKFWATATVLFALLSVWLGSQLYLVQNRSSFVRGFEHELDAAKHLIKIEERFSQGSPRFTEDGIEYVPQPADGMPRTQYVGDPSEEIDNAWDRLHQGRFFLLSEDEAKDAWGPGYEQFYAPVAGGNATELEVTHALHCLDHLRKAFYPEKYPTDAIHGIMHRDHCLDHLRQMVLCNGDLTPIPTRYYKALNANYIDSDRPHTCRNWPSIRDWVWERFNGSLAVPPMKEDLS